MNKDTLNFLFDRLTGLLDKRGDEAVIQCVFSKSSEIIL